MRRFANEPALVVAVVLGLFTAASSYFLDIGAGLDVNTALGKAFGIFGITGAVGGVIRQFVDGPQTAAAKDEAIEQVRDASAWIAEQQKGTPADPEQPYQL